MKKKWDNQIFIKLLTYFKQFKGEHSVDCPPNFIIIVYLIKKLNYNNRMIQIYIRIGTYLHVLDNHIQVL